MLCVQWWQILAFLAAVPAGYLVTNMVHRVRRAMSPYKNGTARGE